MQVVTNVKEINLIYCVLLYKYEKLFLVFKRMIVYIRQPETETEKNALILLPFTLHLWLTVLVTMAFLAISLHVAWNYGMKTETRKMEHSEETFVHSVLYVLGSLSQQG